MDAFDHQLDLYMSYIAVERNLSKHTLSAYRSDLGKLVDYVKGEGRLDLGEVTPLDIIGFLKELNKQELSVRSQARLLSALRSCYKFLIQFP